MLKNYSDKKNTKNLKNLTEFLSGKINLKFPEEFFEELINKFVEYAAFPEITLNNR